MISTRYLGVDVSKRPVEPQPVISRQERQDEVSSLETGGSLSSREQGGKSLSKDSAALNTDSGGVSWKRNPQQQTRKLEGKPGRSKDVTLWIKAG